MRVLYINSVIDYGSTGRIIRDLSTIDEVEPLICYGRKKPLYKKNTYKITGFFGNCTAIVNTFLFNKNGLSNKRNTYELIETIKNFSPDIIHIHNIHGYYLNYQILFDFLNKAGIKTIWTFHDCWPITGYCAHFDLIKCNKYTNGCKLNCPAKFSYPFSLFKQRIPETYELKRDLFTNIDLTIVTPSKWLKSIVEKSFLKDKKIVVINNGIDLEVFSPKCNKNDKFTILLVASVWTEQKGIYELEKLISLLNPNIRINIVGKIKKNKAILKRCNVINRTNNANELASLYSSSHLFINLTLEDTFPTVNIESLACGTPVVTYNTGGSPEIIDKDTGIVIKKYDVCKMAAEINYQYENYTFNSKDCIERAKIFTRNNMLTKYLDLYKMELNR